MDSNNNHYIIWQWHRYCSKTVPMTPSCSCSYSYAARWISCWTFRPIHSCYNNALVSLVSDVAFGFAHQIQLQFYGCCVRFCASNTVTILWVLRLVLRIKYSYNFVSVAFGFAHQIQLQFFVWFCASNTVTIFITGHLCLRQYGVLCQH